MSKQKGFHNDFSGPPGGAAIQKLIQNARQTGLPITSTLQNLQQIGSFMPLLLIEFAEANTDTPVTHNLGRIPSVCLTSESQVGGVVYDGSNLRADWTSSVAVLRATVIGKYSVLLA